MREIKFRAWDKEDKCWIVDSLFIASDGVAHASVGNYFPAEIEPLDNVVLMQYTGLKDKNGKEIYEGDIVRYMVFLPDESWDGEQMVIKFNDSIPGFDTPNNHMFKADPNSYEVIGNIYENPELLEQ